MYTNFYIYYLVKIFNYWLIIVNIYILINLLIYLIIYPHIVMFITNFYLILLSIFFLPTYAVKIVLVLISIFIFNNSWWLYIVLNTNKIYFISLGQFYFFNNFLNINFLFCFDTLSSISGVLVSSLAFATFLFSIEYMYREYQINQLFYLLFFFVTSILYLFIVYDLILILICWELIGLLSFLLVNFYKTRIYSIKAAYKTFIFSRISDMCFLFLLLLCVINFNTTDLSEIFNQVPYFMYHVVEVKTTGYHFLSILGALIFICSSIKAAQFFWHVWLPDAMEAPTPASALIHSSTLVIMGIYLILRFSIVFEFTYSLNTIISWYGSITIGLGSLSAIFQNDLKKLVAYSTISQIGYLFCGCGANCFNEVLLYLIVHALNKANLFIIVGYIVHYFNGNTDMRYMGSVHSLAFDLTIFSIIIWINLSGMPYSLGFFSKEFLLLQCFKHNWSSIFIFINFCLSIFCTPIYVFIFINNVLFGPVKSTYSTWLFAKSSFNKKHIKLLKLKWYKNYQKGILNVISSYWIIILLFIFALICLFADTYLIFIIFNMIGDTKLFLNSAYTILSVNPLLTSTFTNYYYILILNKFIKYIVLLILIYLNHYYSKFKYFNNSILTTVLLTYILSAYILMSINYVLNLQSYKIFNSYFSVNNENIKKIIYKKYIKHKKRKQLKIILNNIYLYVVYANLMNINIKYKYYNYIYFYKLYWTTNIFKKKSKHLLSRSIYKYL